MKVDLSKIDWVVVLLKNGESVRIYPQSISVLDKTTMSIQEKGAKILKFKKDEKTTFNNRVDCFDSL